MSKKITQQSVRKFLDRTLFKKDNTEVVKEDSIYYLKLFGNKIAALESNGKMWISNAGWDSKTTKERLNELPGVNIRQSKGEWYLNNLQWDGTPIYIDTI
jgi:hypothetical protein